MAFVPFQAANDIADRFLELLQRHRIDPPRGSSLEDELLSVSQLIEVARNPNSAEGPDRVAVLRSAAGIHDLAAKVLSVEPLTEFPKFVPHLALIARTKATAASLGQNAPGGGPFDDLSRKIAKLYVACLAAHLGTRVELDSPTNAKGDNPDIIFTVEPRSEPPNVWALAIKSITSRHGQTIFERVTEGAAQIDDPKCRADFGMVIVNCKGALDHDALWNADFPDLDAAIAALSAQLNGLAQNAAADRPPSEWDELFQRKVRRPVMFMGQSLVHLPTPAHEQTPTSLKMISVYDAQGPLDRVGAWIARMLNEFMQKILLGIPGDNGRLPR